MVNLNLQDKIAEVFYFKSLRLLREYIMWKVRLSITIFLYV
jgi:hypothetical protein